MKSKSSGTSMNNIFENERALLGLALIQQNKQLSVEELKKHLGVKDSNVSNIVTLLIKNRLVVFESNNLKCTNAGTQLLLTSFPNLYKQHPDYYTIPFGYGAAEVEQEPIYNTMVRPRFFDAALSDHASIIVGRRGSGKTFIAKYLASNPDNKYGDVISLDTQNALAVLSYILSDFDTNEEGLWIGETAWSFYIWLQIFFFLTSKTDFNHSSLSKPVYSLLQSIGFSKETFEKSLSVISYNFLTYLKKKDADFIIDTTNSSRFADARECAEKYLRRINGVLIVIDTLERYSIRNRRTEIIVSSLIWTTLIFSQKHYPFIQIKCFVRSEVFNLITLSSLPNPAKTFAHTVYLKWTTKDLIQLIKKRLELFSYKTRNYEKLNENIISQENQDEKYDIWNKFFPVEVDNPLFGLKESSIVYILRHTQLEPRHIILSLNAIARVSVEENTFPFFTEKNLKLGVQQSSVMLARELINAYEDIYPNIGSIMSVFAGSPNVFKGNYLDKLAPRSKKLWSDTMPYDRILFQKMLCELGLIGKVVQITNRYMESIFEYGLNDHLLIDSKDECVIHPMFYEKLNINILSKNMIYPRSIDAVNKFFA